MCMTFSLQRYENACKNKNVENDSDDSSIYDEADLTSNSSYDEYGDITDDPDEDKVNHANECDVDMETENGDPVAETTLSLNIFRQAAERHKKKWQRSTELHETEKYKDASKSIKKTKSVHEASSGAINIKIN